MSSPAIKPEGSNPPTPTPAPAPTKVNVPSKNASSHRGKKTAPVTPTKGAKPRMACTPPLSKRLSGGPRALKMTSPPLQFSPAFHSPVSPGLGVPVSPKAPTGGIRRARPGSVDFLQRRHRRTMSDTPTSPLWSPAFEFMHSEDPEVELEDEKYLSHVKVDEIAPPAEIENAKVMRSISFPAQLKKDHHRTASFGAAPVSPGVPAGLEGAAPGVKPPMSPGGIPRRRTLGAINCSPKGRPIAIPGSPRAQALNTRRTQVAGAKQRVSPVVARKGSIGSASSSASPSSGRPPSGNGKAGYTAVSTQRAQRARRALPRRAATDLTASRPSADAH